MLHSGVLQLADERMSFRCEAGPFTQKSLGKPDTLGCCRDALRIFAIQQDPSTAGILVLMSPFVTEGYTWTLLPRFTQPALSTKTTSASGVRYSVTPPSPITEHLIVSGR